MCGIAGFIASASRGGAAPARHVLERMTDLLRHRGPDSGDVWHDDVASVGLGHRRLAIRDLSPTGAQPMTSSCGRLVIIYNGEVYSHREVAAELASTGRRLRGTSDTEVMLEAMAEWGVDAVVPKLIGMFAIAVFDRQTRELTLIRDRLGIKPLYWGVVDGLLMFGSELKALRAVPGWQPRLDRNALAAYMRHNYIPAPATIYQGVAKLEPGTLLKFGRDGVPRISRYWNLRDIAERSVASIADISDREAVDRLDALLGDAVRRRLVADVPIGALLSGGVDSSLVTALMAEIAEGRINTFSIGFTEKGYDEAPYARAVANHIGTDHTELYAAPEHALDMIGKLPDWYDEPFADSSQLPTALVCALTRRHVTVVLSGDGGDEVFAGYQRYALALQMVGETGLLPRALRPVVAKGMLATPEKLLDAVGERLPGRFRKNAFGSKVRGYATALQNDDPDAYYLRMISHWHEPDKTVIGAREPRGILWDRTLAQSMPHFLDRMQLVDTLTYLPDDILTKVDRASMVVALEARVPLLDHRVVEFAWSLPQRMKLRDGVTKWALREVLDRRVPRALIDRPKMGFGVPLGAWLRGPLRDWAQDLLDPQMLKAQGVFDPGPIQERWRSHLAGTDWSYPLWTVLMAQAWFKANPEVTL